MSAHDTGGAELVLEDRFSMVTEWVLDADIGDCALRPYLPGRGRVCGGSWPLLFNPMANAVEQHSRWAGRGD